MLHRDFHGRYCDDQRLALLLELAKSVSDEAGATDVSSYLLQQHALNE